MSDENFQPDDPRRQGVLAAGKAGPQEGTWAQPVDRLNVQDYVPAGLTGVNLQGRQTAGALQGFGQLWKKTYRVRLEGVDKTAAEVMQTWKEKFPEFQPPGNLM